MVSLYLAFFEEFDTTDLFPYLKAVCRQRFTGDCGLWFGPGVPGCGCAVLRNALNWFQCRGFSFYPHSVSYHALWHHCIVHLNNNSFTALKA